MFFSNYAGSSPSSHVWWDTQCSLFTSLEGKKIKINPVRLSFGEKINHKMHLDLHIIVLCWKRWAHIQGALHLPSKAWGCSDPGPVYMPTHQTTKSQWNLWLQRMHAAMRYKTCQIHTSNLSRSSLGVRADTTMLRAENFRNPSSRALSKRARSGL